MPENWSCVSVGQDGDEIVVTTPSRIDPDVALLLAADLITNARSAILRKQSSHLLETEPGKPARALASN